MKDWTPEDIRNAETYGVCMTCGVPRTFAHGERKTDHGTTVMWSGIVTTCGHTETEHLSSVDFPALTKSVRTDPEQKA